MEGVECGENSSSHPLSCGMACREDIHNFQLLFIFSNTLVIISNYSQPNVTFIEFISTDFLNVSGGSSAHHQEHKILHTASVSGNKYCC
jgi:hypothetical protein